MKKCEIRGHSYQRRLIKLLLMMKFTVFFLLIFALQLSASVYSQQTRLSVNFDYATIEEVVAEIESQTNLTFFYSRDVLNVNQKVILKSKNMLLDDMLLLIEDQTGLTFNVVRDQILVSKQGIQQQLKIDISGTVVDTQGAPLPGVSVVVKGTTVGIVSDFDGNYSLTNISSDAVLIFSFVGMKTVEIPIEGQTVINVTLEEDAIGIEEVVAIGYGTRAKSDLTGAVVLH